MERYIDAEILKNKILDDMAKAEREGKDLNGYTDSLFHLKTTPAADVAPKTEVAREIFEETYKLVASKIPPHIRPIFKDDLDFEDGFRNGKTDALLDVLVLIAELKKKYTEDQT